MEACGKIDQQITRLFLADGGCKDAVITSFGQTVYNTPSTVVYGAGIGVSRTVKCVYDKIV